MPSSQVFVCRVPDPGPRQSKITCLLNGSRLQATFNRPPATAAGTPDGSDPLPARPVRTSDVIRFISLHLPRRRPGRRRRCRQRSPRKLARARRTQLEKKLARRDINPGWVRAVHFSRDFKASVQCVRRCQIRWSQFRLLVARCSLVERLSASRARVFCAGVSWRCQSTCPRVMK